MPKTWLCAFLLCLLANGSLGAESAVFSIYTDHWPPYSYRENDRVTGIATEIVRGMMRHVGHPDTIQLVPWKRAYLYIEKRSDVAVYSMSRLPSREKLFKWVGPLAKFRLDLLALSNSGTEIRSLDDARLVDHIGVLAGGSADTFLTKAGFENLIRMAEAGLDFPLLLRGRMDLVAADMIEWRYNALQKGIDPNQVKSVYTIRNNQLYLAFSKMTPNEIINRWQAALDIMKTDGTYDRIIESYKE